VGQSEEKKDHPAHLKRGAIPKLILKEDEDREFELCIREGGIDSGVHDWRLAGSSARNGR